ncbi:MAG: enoyl-CoA hydratase/isomerase family protein [Pseudomonadota bacterium]|nr:enoyl-CoA hydratase/isomerase family protein [Pseudomonadota bacterium]
MTTDFKLLTVARAGRVATVTIDNPPVNVITMALLAELEALSVMLKRAPDLTVVVMRSADPDFFLAHFDVAAILERPTAGTAQRDAQIKPFHSLCERFRTMNKVVIGQIEGRIGGGGSELAANFDMRFGVRDKTRVNQMEVPLGIMPGGTGTQRLPRLIGHGRAMELILSGDDMDAETAERWGYINRIFAPDAITPYVDNLARRIASFPPTAVRVAKESVNNSEKPWLEGLFEEAYLFEGLLRTEAAQRNMQRFLEIGGQTREGESRMDELCAALGETDVT